MKLLVTILFCTLSVITFAQDTTETKEKLYHPEADAMADVEEAIATAKAEGKHVILKIGGNWCGWCYRFQAFCEADDEIKTIIEDNFVTVYVNYSKENKNEALMKKYRFPNRFGFPVFVVLDSNGDYLHVQNSAYLESGKGYDKGKVLNFFKGWTPAVLDESNY
jgi:thioredoxin-related protein